MDLKPSKGGLPAFYAMALPALSEPCRFGYQILEGLIEPGPGGFGVVEVSVTQDRPPRRHP